MWLHSNSRIAGVNLIMKCGEPRSRALRFGGSFALFAVKSFQPQRSQRNRRGRGEGSAIWAQLGMALNGTGQG